MKNKAEKPVGRPAKQERTPFGEQLYAARLKNGFSQAHVAEQLGITQTAYADWERYPVALRPEQIDAVANILSIPVQVLFEKNPQKVTQPKPTKRLRKMFDMAVRLSSEHQNEVAKVLEPFVRQHAKDPA